MLASHQLFSCFLVCACRIAVSSLLCVAGDDEDGSAGDWLGGDGLKFHTTADKAFSMANKRFKDADGPDVAANREVAASIAKKQSEARMAEMRRQQKK